MLEAPPTIRLPRLDEIPNDPEILERIRKRESANIVEGYTLNYNDTHDLPFKFYAEINVNNSRLWNLFTLLTNPLPDTLSLIYNLHDKDVIHSEYRNKYLILKHLENYKTELTQDCNLEFGLIFQTEDKLEEVFVSNSKFIKLWGNNEVAFRQLMNSFDIKEVSNLNFIDEFPTVIEPLILFNQQAKRTEIVVTELNDFFNPKKKSWKFW